MSPLSSRIVAALVGLALLLGLAACSRDETGRAADVGRDLLSRWSSGDAAGAARLTDDAEAARAALEGVTDALSVTKAEFTPGEPQKAEKGDRVTLPFQATLTLRGLGGWKYAGGLTLTRTGDEGPWRVDWTPAVIHPRLTAKTALRRQRNLPERAPILSRDGSPLMKPRPVVEIGIWPAKVTDASRAYKVLQDALDIDTGALALRVRKAKPDEFVSVITLREPDFAAVRREVTDLPGVISRKATRTLAPTRAFARAVLGTVAPATKETLESAGPTAAPTDQVGSSGLQEAFQQQLAGTAGGAVELVDAQTRVAVATLQEFAPRPGTPIRTTLDTKVQSAAEQALMKTTKPAALVAIQPSRGDILAVANGPEGSAGYNRAFVGRYPPGSTFKVVSTAALLATGLGLDDTVACPQTAVVNGKRFQNQDEFVLGEVPFRTDFARSCNTAFVGLAKRLPAHSLPQQAAAFGIGGEWHVGLPAFTGSVPEPTTPVDRAASVIGQAKVEMSPLAMASVAATVQAGQFRQPALLQDPAPERYSPPSKVSPKITGQLRTLMRAVVTDGSGRALASLPGKPAAKTGTAEFGTDNPPHTHAWMIGFRGDLAFAALIEDGGSGGRDAGPVVSAFLSSLNP
jgi:cell division protein FtsI/penicillin-binding protein 2